MAEEVIPMGKVVMIDNYDSFAWNVYQLLSQEGADVVVFRNDEVTIEQLAAMKPSRLVISPGPGHPLYDSGICTEAIKYFSGKIPIFGVCMGEECIFALYGGTVASAGEIMHGKTSPIEHDGKGIFKDIPQQIAVTRYHSLAGQQASLPDCLEVSARTSNGIIMAVRHKQYTIEGVQFHPESILTESGNEMVRNFLNIHGGTWSEDLVSRKTSSTASTISLASPATLTGKESILDRIYAKRKLDINAQKLVPSLTPNNLQRLYDLGVAPPQIDFVERLASEPGAALLAEIKRASPSKGDIEVDANAGEQAKLYAEAGAAAISVLTEPHWFKGTIDDMRYARLAIDKIQNRPAVLRKEFIFDEYQILEARLNGADSVLLIVKMLDEELLSRLYSYSKVLGMEPLVEVNSAAEMARAIQLGAKVIGVNNRDLHSFAVDLGTTSSLVSMVPKGTILCALSGISARSDVEKYLSEGVGGFLVGEALMRAKDTKAFVAQLIGK
ncbi:indole-3-glycerol phosphate synthase-domain-containing protein [Lipomyces oligophaga]|uniref:indole-3-glycerol phosphate synthase-domain-containing protein n=1 Tax=Lipomyces oligophaga TaxID=45792 RepID=UPI0034CE87DF